MCVGDIQTWFKFIIYPKASRGQYVSLCPLPIATEPPLPEVSIVTGFLCIFLNNIPCICAYIIKNNDRYMVFFCHSLWGSEGSCQESQISISIHVRNNFFAFSSLSSTYHQYHGFHQESNSFVDFYCACVFILYERQTMDTGPCPLLGHTMLTFPDWVHCNHLRSVSTFLLVLSALGLLLLVFMFFLIVFFQHWKDIHLLTLEHRPHSEKLPHVMCHWLSSEWAMFLCVSDGQCPVLNSPAWLLWTHACGFFYGVSSPHIW